MNTTPIKYAVATVGFYVGYRLFMLADSGAGVNNIGDDLLSTVQTAMSDADFKGRFSPIDPKTGEDYSALIYSASREYGMPSLLLAAQLKQESGFNHQAYNRISGAMGLAQFMPATATEWGVKPYDPKSAIDGCAKYMRWLWRRHGTWRLAVAAYNWGTGNVQKKGIAAMPTETRNYVAVIYDKWASVLPA